MEIPKNVSEKFVTFLHLSNSPDGMAVSFVDAKASANTVTLVQLSNKWAGIEVTFVM